MPNIGREGVGNNTFVCIMAVDLRLCASVVLRRIMEQQLVGPQPLETTYTSDWSMIG